MKKKKFLKEGDVIHLKDGMDVYTDIPEKFIYSNEICSNELCSHEYELGDVLTIPNEKVNNIVEKDVNKILNIVGVNYNISEDDIRSLLLDTLKNVKCNDFCLNGGEFVVIDTYMDGGGYGHGPHDVYPDGYKVFCKKLKEDGSYDPDGAEISFYQSGCFTVCHENIEPIRTLKKSFK